MKTIVITGSTRGIGYGLADAFLDLGCAVAISGRAQTSVESAIASLSVQYEPARIWGYPCDVTQYAQVQTLWDTALERLGQIDVWINNAGIAHAQQSFWAQPPEQIQAVVETNLVGTMFGSKVALHGMLQQGHGSLYNMEGLGSDGRAVTGLALYGTTKAGIRYLTESLVQEVAGTQVRVGTLSPGMVTTELLTAQYSGRPDDWERDKRVFNIIADPVETVAPWLAQRVLSNQKNGARLKWLTKTKLAWRFLTSPFHQRDLFGDQAPV
jgi:NAD(P)-dependent dehydrogenase (short-subunit alcohol dehydrogenase family)